MDLRTLKMRRIRWFVLLPLLCLMVGLYFVGLSNNHRKLAELRDEELTLTSELNGLRMEENRLRIQLDDVDSNSVLDAAARSEDFVKVGEVRFTIDNSEGQLEMYTKEELEIMSAERELRQY